LYMSTPAYCKIEIGTTDVNLSRLDQIAKLYDLSLVELLTGEKAAPTGLMLLEDALLKRENQIKELQKLIGELQEKLHS
jgi:transcriptional regulator with XRE-family HTH domain